MKMTLDCSFDFHRELSKYLSKKKKRNRCQTINCILMCFSTYVYREKSNHKPGELIPALNMNFLCVFFSVLCVYNGVTFAQGQTISDGCSRTCRCDDASTNYYNCYDR